MLLRSGIRSDEGRLVNYRPRKRHRNTGANDTLNDDCLLQIFQALDHTPITLGTLRLVCRRWTRLLESGCVVGFNVLYYYYFSYQVNKIVIIIVEKSKARPASTRSSISEIRQ